MPSKKKKIHLLTLLALASLFLTACAKPSPQSLVKKAQQSKIANFQLKIDEHYYTGNKPVRFYGQINYQRSPFVMQADSHLDTSTDVRVYQQTLANIRADKPDFMVDLGDTTMVDKFGKFYTRAESQYRAQRYYLGQIAHSIPVLLTLGNHDGEKGERLEGKDSMPMWSVPSTCGHPGGSNRSSLIAVGSNGVHSTPKSARNWFSSPYSGV